MHDALLIYFLFTEGAKVVAPSPKKDIGLSFIFQMVRFLWFDICPGVITSGIPSPTLGENIAMGYIESGWHKKGTRVEVEVRMQLRKAVVTPMPFVKPNYWRG